jgi:hypothetical protein
VAGYFRLALPEYLDEKAHANFVITHKIEQAQARAIGEGAKQHLYIKWFVLFGHAPLS